MQKFGETGNLRHIYKNQLDKICFFHDHISSNSKALAKITISDKALKERAYEVPANDKYDWYQRGLANMVNKIFDKKTGSGASVKEEVVQELHKPVIKKLKGRKCMKDLTIIFEHESWNL